jgi:hypothetical protein
MADPKRAGLLWSDRAGNVASALLLLVLGAILSQLKWNGMILAGTILSAVLIVYMALRFMYAQRHPEPQPLTVEALRAELKRAGIIPAAEHGARLGEDQAGELFRLQPTPKALLRIKEFREEPERAPAGAAFRRMLGIR